MPRIDAHTHLFPPSQRAGRNELAADDPTFAEIYGDPAAKMATAEELVETLDAAGFDGAVMCGFAFEAEDAIREQNVYLLESARRWPGRLGVLATVNPSLPGWQREAEASLTAGARGFGELRPANQGWDPLGRTGAELCEFAVHHGAILQWHVSEPVGHAYPGKHGGIDPAALIQLASAHPAVRMIAAHLGGGLSFYAQMPEVKSAIENIYFDTAALSLLYDDQSVARLVDLVGPQRVLFASDYPLLSPRRQLERVTAVLDGAIAASVCGGNADKLLFG